MARALVGAILVFLVSTAFTNKLPDTIVPRASLETHLMVVNVGTQDILKTVVSGIDSFDWENGSGPAGNFQNIHIKAGDYYERREEVNRWASNCPFTMALHNADGTIDTYRVNQKYAIGKADAGFQHLEGNRKISYQRLGDKTLMITVF